MHCLLVAATVGEIAPFTDHLSQTDKLDHIELDVDILITGIGALATAYALTRYLQHKKPDLVIQAGVGGLFDRSLPLGTVFAVKQDTMADMGVTEKKNFHTPFDTGWMQPNEAPYKKAVLVNPASALLKRIRLPKANAVTVNEVSTRKEKIDYYKEKYKALIESM
ncbi:MAG: futalosine hydrolase, partial [Flavihumibacter sp.]